VNYVQKAVKKTNCHRQVYLLRITLERTVMFQYLNIDKLQ